MVVLHYTAMVSAEAALARLCDPVAEVSAHYLICEKGRVWRMVDEAARAWHAGAGQWGAVTDVNSRSVGIELANCGDHPFPEPQIVALEGLLAGILARWDIAPERVIGHSDMAPTRKFDPGARFDWRRLALGGLSVWPQSGAVAGDFWTDLERFGYAWPQDGENPQAQLLAAFRLRFRPWARGPLADQDRAIAHDLANRFPVDHRPTSA
ncbi:MAG: N-acetylmuramoyl-L-alanine amidase [Rhodobacterales bacterium]|nr:N-acetylmuramoyl-L-alanine amidase [Rhodobacterales bacterium]